MSDEVCSCYGDLLDEARNNALHQAIDLITDAAKLGLDGDELPHRCVMLGGALALLELVIDAHFPPEERNVLQPQMITMRATLHRLRALDAVEREEHRQ